MTSEPAHVSHGRPQLLQERQAIEGKVLYPLEASFPIQPEALERLADHRGSPLRRNRRVIHNLCNLQSEISSPKMIRFPQHESGLSICFERNIDIDPNELVVGNDRNLTGLVWVSREEHQRAVETRSKWWIRIRLEDGLRRELAASSFNALIDFFDEDGTCASYGTASEFPDDMDFIVITHHPVPRNSSGKKKRPVEKMVDLFRGKWVSDEQRQKAIELTSIWTIAIRGPRIRSFLLAAAEWDVLIEAAKCGCQREARREEAVVLCTPSNVGAGLQSKGIAPKKPFQPSQGRSRNNRRNLLRRIWEGLQAFAQAVR